MTHSAISPPGTAVKSITEVLHGIKVTDPYRWLEDQNSPQTRKWIEDQAAYTRAYFAAAPKRERVRTRVRKLLAMKNFISEVWNAGDRYFFLKRQKNGEQPVIVMKEGWFGRETVLVDPNHQGKSTSLSASIIAVSEEGHLLAYAVRQGGTDHAWVEILDVERRHVLQDRLPEGSRTGIVFAADGGGFYYAHRELYETHPHYRAVYWHQFGTERSQDREIFFAGEQPDLVLGILGSAESNQLVYIVCSTGKLPRTSVYLQEMSTNPGRAKIVVQEIEGCFVPFFVHGQLLAYTDFAAPNARIVRVDAGHLAPADWYEIVPESDARIQEFAVVDDQVFVSRIDRFSTRIEAFCLHGRPAKGIPIPSHGTVHLLNRTNVTKKLFFTFTSISEPAALYCYDATQEELLTWGEVNPPVDTATIAFEETAYPSKDGTSIPLFLAARKDLLVSGPLPTFLTGYGGFGSCVTPRFTAFATFLMEQGFLFAVAALRGGSELGEQWHRAGQRENRQNAFNDFVAAAEWLIREQRSISGRIAIGGGSNAGLLVGAAITQRPSLFRAAICLGPLLDMTRYHLFDSAAGWTGEYGSPEDEEDFQSLFSYSPYHRVRDGVAYPAALFISGDADTRCNPMHARKMTARLQAATSSPRPILLDYKPAWGHMPVQPLSTKIEALTDRLAFLCRELGVRVQPER